ncbi:FAD-dependent monooxygenase [Mesorhizobium sp. CA18]|uniref:FAD-dependent oxidoreductase n=1 Tax=unclassified Mesorhizobium TaxID=325217 RepID=UPI001CCBB52B|nr:MULTISPECIES: NAD(P)/FAD-dependent oxidoreductase [unclassified Mesorhizobium]MBZ9736570.1 FAD-dependent monooxygenase [Mesorhizobium sp. CA9]MBZ9827216.1 FAD-dependent monooxygenase [Mesorhizobium sp. CA18]MBZ9832759.1 FAD-dependent monooxygenase [Mesorhizobium sp. CA2]MBZ9839036.1 FAD-dependent monooxygenase [Mesorhizobium sp. CA3]MBZ9879489.1 FAD-dependent monooxygenase [Mesorhizobium sp. Ca11]
MSIIEDRTAPAVPADRTEVEVAIVGAGLAGTVLALSLAKAGRKIALVDPHRIHHDEFRAEKTRAEQMGLFEKLGLGPVFRSLVTPMTDVHVFRFGQLFERKQSWEYAFSYTPLVNGLRAALPPQVPLTIGKVAEVSTGPDRQRLVLTDGSVIDARLLVVATGYSEAVRRAIGVERVEESKAHSLTLGFDLAVTPQEFGLSSLTFYGRRIADRIAFLTIFRIGERMRANMFVYRTVADPWVRSFREDPQRMLLELMPEIAARCGNFAVASEVEVRQVGLTTTQGHRRDGVVFIGDAFATTCPAQGDGIHRVLTDVYCLSSTHIPAWLETPGMAADKICAFYDDPAKIAADARAMRASIYAKRITTETGLEWRLRRLRNNTARRLMIFARRFREAGKSGDAGPGPEGTAFDQTGKAPAGLGT